MRYATSFLAAVLSCAVTASAATWYVSPVGKADQDGTQEKPWDLASALNNQQRNKDNKPMVQPGDDVVLLPGVYKRRPAASFDIGLIGTAEKPVVIHSASTTAGPHAVVDGGFNFVGPADHVWLRDVEVLVSEPRQGKEEVSKGSHPTDLERPGGGIIMGGDHNCKVINCVVHDTNGGFGLWVNSLDSEVYGCVIYDNGWPAPDRGHGHGIYCQNREGTKLISDCLFTGGYAYSMHAYGSKNAFIEHFTIEKNIAYNTGTFLVGGAKPNKDDHILSNYFYYSTLQVGYGSDNEDVEVRGNTLVNGGIAVRPGKTVVTEGNWQLGQNEARPDKTIVAWLPNKYDDHRAHVAVYKLRPGAKASPDRGTDTATLHPVPPSTESVEEVKIDAGAPLKNGDKFELFDPRDVFDKPVGQGTVAGGKIAVPVQGEFAVFILRKLYSGDSMPTHLMFDRRWILNHHGARGARGQYTFHLAPPAKPAGPVVVADKPWESLLLNWGTILIENGLWRLWYETWDHTMKDDYDSRLCYAQSTDGVHWEKPELGLIEFQGSKANNIVFEHTMSPSGFHGHCVFVDPTSPPEVRYRMMFVGALRRRDQPERYPLYPMSFAHSPDGLRWTWGLPGFRSQSYEPPRGLGRSSFTAYGSDTQTVVRWDDTLRQYVGYFRTREPDVVRAIGRAVTNDFGSWPQPETILACDELDPVGTDIYNAAASLYRVPGDEGHFFFMSMYDHQTEQMTVQLATSRDGRRYKRLCREPFITTGTDFDKGCTHMCPGIHRVGDEVVMMYGCADYRHDVKLHDLHHAGGFVVLRFPVDRFQGLHVADRFECTVSLERAEKGEMHPTFNAVVAPGGSIRAGVLKPGTEAEYLPGFAPDDCDAVTGDGVALPTRFKGGMAPAGTWQAPHELQLFMEKATLFSYSY